MAELSKLDYEYDALEPHIDAKTMEIHHSKHHQAYVDKFNKAIEGTDLEEKDVNEILKDIEAIPEKIRAAVINNGGGHSNHALFWKSLKPSGGNPTGAIGAALTKEFGSIDEFKEEMEKAAMSRFGSGWAWLVVNKGSLEVISTGNQDSPLSEGMTPLLCIDVWEHAYYLKYQNRRPEYLKAIWNIINWEEVSRRFEEAK
ncbi:MAG: superoxide dismutase [Nanoarchaeota archaeon]